MKTELPIVLVAKAGTLKLKLGYEKDPKRLAYAFFEDNRGRKVLVTHGTEYGYWPQTSDEALRLFPQAEVIYCCFPKTMRQNTGDLRIIGSHDKATQIAHSQIPDGFIISIMEAR